MTKVTNGFWRTKSRMCSEIRCIYQQRRCAARYSHKQMPLMSVNIFRNRSDSSFKACLFLALALKSVAFARWTNLLFEIWADAFHYV